MCQPLQRQASEPRPPSTPSCPSASSSHLYDEVALAEVSTHPEGSGGHEPGCLFPLRNFTLLGYGVGADGPAPCTLQVKGHVTSGRWVGTEPAVTMHGEPSRYIVPGLVGVVFRILSAFEKYKPARGCVKLYARKGIAPQDHANSSAVLVPCHELAV